MDWALWWEATFVGFAVWCLAAVLIAGLKPEWRDNLDAAQAIATISLGAFAAALVV